MGTGLNGMIQGVMGEKTVRKSFGWRHLSAGFGSCLQWDMVRESGLVWGRDPWKVGFCVKNRFIVKPTVGLPGGASGKEPPANPGDSRDMGSIPGSGRSPGGGHGNPLQYSCLENSIDRGAWQATVHGVAQSQTLLRRLSSSSPL